MNSQRLVRDKVQTNSVQLSGNDFTDKVLEQISETILNIKTRTQTSEIVDDVSEVLELVNSYLHTKNIKSEVVFARANSLREELGTYSMKRQTKEGTE